MKAMSRHVSLCLLGCFLLLTLAPVSFSVSGGDAGSVSGGDAGSVSGGDAGSVSGGDAGAGRQKIQVCMACHAVDGNSVSPQWPRLAGQHASYLVKQLRDYRSGRRVSAQMTAFATDLDDQDIADIAAWFSSQEALPGVAEKDLRLLEVGARVYRAGNERNGVPACIACHGPSGRGNPAAVYPALDGQHAAYIQQQLLAYRSGARDNDPDAVMRSIAARLSDVELKAVSIYISGLY